VNGIGKLPVARIFKKASSALETATYVGASGTISGTGATLVLANVDASGAGAHVASSGSLSVRGSTKPFTFNGSVSFRRIGSTLYIDANRTFWESLVYSTLPPNASEISLGRKLFPQVVGKWIQLTTAAGNDFEYHVLGVTDPRELAGVFVAANPAGFSAGSGPTVAGIPTIELTSSEGGKLDVATVGSPLPLQVRGKTSAAQLSLTFSYPTSLQPITAPPGARELSQILAKIKSSG